MRRTIFKRLLISLILVAVLLGYVIAYSNTIFLIEKKEHPTIKPWPTCATVPKYRIRCDPTQDPFATTTTWHKKNG
jgi:disulfide bond formation protein DsbB